MKRRKEALQRDPSEEPTLLDRAFFPSDQNLDFVTSSDTLHSLLSIPYKTSANSVEVHSVGGILFLNSTKQNLKAYEALTSTFKLENEIEINRNIAANISETVSLPDLIVDEVTESENEDLSTFDSFSAKYKRTLQWSLNNKNLLIGSNMVTFNDKRLHDSEFSVSLHKSQSDITRRMSVSLYLENRVNGVDALALCLHREGTVNEYKILRTHELPKLCNSSFNKEKVSVEEIENQASKLLDFLKEKCKEGKSYFLNKSKSEKNLIELYELTFGNLSRNTSLEGQKRWMYNLAMLFYRVAVSLFSSKAPIKADSKSKSYRELLLKSLELLDDIANKFAGPQRLLLRAALHDLLGYSYTEQPLEQDKEKSYKFALAHWKTAKTLLRTKSKESLLEDDEDLGLKEINDKIKTSVNRLEKNIDVTSVEICRVGFRRKDGVLVESVEQFFSLLRKKKDDLVNMLELFGDLWTSLARLSLAEKNTWKNLGFENTKRLEDFLSKCKLETKTRIEEAQENNLLFPLIHEYLSVKNTLLIIPKLNIDSNKEGLILSEKFCFDSLFVYFCGFLLAESKQISAESKKLTFKINNCLNEIGKFYIKTLPMVPPGQILTSYSRSQKYLFLAVKGFKKSKDFVNVVASLCNLNYQNRQMALKCDEEGIYIEKAVKNLELAQLLLESIQGEDHRLWKQRVSMELGTTHLISAVKLQSKVKIDLNIEENKKCIKEFFSSLSVFESQMKLEVPGARGKVANVHFHLGTHYFWLASLGVERCLKLLGKDKGKTSYALTLAQRHLKFAVDNSSEEYQKLYIERFKQLREEHFG
eukprot:snap_masked-scaffold_9-processed-gene-7.35-mRNA-1 protein AED:1.00 eAED:1.00 QI:0/-1/0/0/-1/1/1/0/814